MRDLLKKIVSFAKNHPVIISSILVSVFVPLVYTLAYGPNRNTYTVAKPADHIVFNSIVDNPTLGGNEQDFVGIREVGTSNAWSNSVQAKPGKEYYVRMYVHNNAASNLKLVAQNVVAKLNVPTNTAKSITLQGQVSASNATPATVWDEATLKSDRDFNLAYVAGSATYTSNKLNGVALPDSIVTNTGAKLGYDKLDGNIPGCFEYSGYVTLKVKPQFAPEEKSDIALSKKVRNKTNGEKAWNEIVNAKSGDTVQFQIEAKNNGSATIDNMVLRDILPNGLEYVAGTTKLYNKANNGLKVSDNLVADSGINVGSYGPNANVFVRFDAKVSENQKLPKCGENTLTNLAQASNQKIVQNDTASVKVNKTCETPKPSTYKCESLSIKPIRKTSGSDTTQNKPFSSETFEFDTKYSLQNAEFVGIKYVIKNSKGETVIEKTVNNGSKLTVEIPIVGKYTVTSTVLSKDGQNSTQNCEKDFEVVKNQEKPSISIRKTVNNQKNITVEAEKEFNYELLVTNNGNVDLRDVVVSDKAPANITFISADRGTLLNNNLTYKIANLKVGESQIITIKAKATAVGISSRNIACVNTPVIPGDNDGCDSANIEVPKKNTPPAPTPKQPELPSELPKTGADNLLEIIGLSSVVLATSYYVASRKLLK